MLVGERAGGTLLHAVIQGSRVLLSNGPTALPQGVRVLHGVPCIHLAEEGNRDCGG